MIFCHIFVFNLEKDLFMQFIFQNEKLILFGSFFIAFIITFVSIPPILEVARAKKLYAVPNGRTSHEHVTPNLGGLAIFSGFVISSMIFVQIAKIPYIQYILAGAITIFFIGLKDDIIGLSPLKKFIGEIIAAGLIIDLGNIRITDLHGLFGIGIIDYYSSDIISLVIIIAIVNAVNLIDGIDGLASGVGILVSITFGIWFYLVGQFQLAVLSAALIGALIAFFIFNVFSTNNKIFMGDIGSLLLGFILSIFVIKFNELNNGEIMHSVYFIKTAPAVSIGILILPVFDTVRVMTIRMVKGISPFKADKRHVHHYLLELTHSHKKSTFILLTVNILFIIISFLLRNISIFYLTLILLLLASILSFVPYKLVVLNRKKKDLITAKAFKAQS